MKDFYYKSEENDTSFNPSILEETNEIEQLLSQLKMLLFTNQGDVLGATDLGLNLERLIFETNYNQYTILNNIKFQVGQYLVYDDSRYNLEYDLKFLSGTVRDIALLTVFINGQQYLNIGIK